MIEETKGNIASLEEKEAKLAADYTAYQEALARHSDYAHSLLF